MTDQLKFGAVTRGEGKVYVCISGFEDSDKLSARASFSDGARVPVAVLRPRNGRAVVMFPDFKTTVTLFIARDDKGE